MKVAKTHKGKKYLEDNAPKKVENRKKSLFVKGRKCSNELTQFWDELAKFRFNEIVKFSKNNDTLPFENADDIQKFCQKNHCSLFTFFSHNKKRPMNVIFGRLFEYQLMEMYEFGVSNFQRASESLKAADIELQSVPALIFQGDQWETDFAPLRSLFMDFFVGDLKGVIVEEQIQHALTFTIAEENQVPYIAVRHYQVNPDNSDSPLTPCAPSFNLTPRRKMLPDSQLMEKALEMLAVDKKKKNITKNDMGETIGRVFTPRQKTGEIVPKNFKGLPKFKFERPAEPADDAL